MIDTRFYIAHGPLSLSVLTEGLNIEPLDSKFADEMISGANPLGGSAVGDITFLENKRHKTQAETAKATACLVSERLAETVGACHIIPIISKTPRGHFARIVSRLVTRRTLSSETGDAKIAKTAKVHASAVIGSGAIIGDGVEVEPYSVIGPGVQIGAGSRIGSHVTIKCAILGENCNIKPSAVIGGAGFGVAQDENGKIDIPHIGRVILGNNVSIGSQSCVDRGQLTDTILGNDVKLDNLVQIGHNVTIGDGTVIAGHVGVSGSCVIGKNVRMAGNVGIADHVTIGDNVTLIARAGVMHNIPDGETWSGTPAMPAREHMRIVKATHNLVKKPKKGA